MSALGSYFKQRLPFMATAGVLGLLISLCRSPAQSTDLEGIEQSLRDEHQLEADELVWEPSGGAFLDFVWGRPFVVAARAQTGQNTSSRDIYRTFARVTPEGRVVHLGTPRNLTATTRTDEHQLRKMGKHLFFASDGPDSPPSITILSPTTDDTSEQHSLLERLQVALANFSETGSPRGIGRIDFIGSTQKDGLLLRSDPDSTELMGVVDGEPFTAELGKNAVLPSALHRIERHRAPLPWPHFFANLGRELFGTEAIAQLERSVFSARDRAHRLLYGISHQKTVPQRPQGPTPLPSPSEKAKQVVWPPLSLAATSSKHPQDGKWSALSSSLLPQTSEPWFYRTVLHTDPDRPYAELHLVMFDMRRLKLGMRAGYEDPEPDHGPPGSGQLPEDEATRVVATFNGAFKSTHGRYGMKAEGRVLVDPKEGAATVRVDADGRVGFGTYAGDDSLKDAVAFRQNLDPLVANGEVNPKGRTTWGEHVDATGVAIERSALCLHVSGHVIYAWATEATGLSLAHGLLQAGCEYAIHLDMNPGHVAFLLNRVQSIDPLRAEGEAIDSRMKVNTTRYVRWSPKDFFYLATTESLLSSGAATAGSTGGNTAESSVHWKPSPGVLPTPAYAVGILSGTQKIGPISIEMDRIEPDRLNFAIQVGTMESTSRVNQAPPEGEVLIAWGLGHTTYGSRPGLALGRHRVVSLHRRFSTLVLGKNQAPQLLPPGEPKAEEEDQIMIQFPTLARDGALLPHARELGGVRPRSAMCVSFDGALLVGRLEHDSAAPLAQALLDQGCSLVVELDRGSHSPPIVQRKGTDAPPQMGHEQSMLYGMDRAMQPRTYAF